MKKVISLKNCCLCYLFSLQFFVAGRHVLEFGVSFYFWLSLVTQAWKKISLNTWICCDLAFAVHAVVLMYFDSSLLTSYPTLLLDIKDRWWFSKDNKTLPLLCPEIKETYFWLPLEVLVWMSDFCSQSPKSDFKLEFM